ncbi:MAG: hypothetical protein Q4D34_01865 [Eggerthellaceae bacterium]|nr:hypothetical protein [Eggerthellaceae bacterium]
MSQQRTNENVRYYDASALERAPLFPSSYKKFALIIVLIAAIVGVGAFLYYNYTVLQAPARTQAAIEDALSQEVSADYPYLESYVGWSADEVVADLDANGISHFEIPSSDPSGNTYVLFHAPSTLSAEDAQSYYEKGINKLEAPKAAQLLYGGWELSISSDPASGIRVRYADFKSGSIDAAIASAISQQGLADSEMKESGTDTSGNTYQTGTIEIDEEEYTWRISALKLSDVYSVDISDDAIFVGIRINQA